MRYTHDAKKRTANLKKHGYDFKDVPGVIESSAMVTFEDPRVRQFKAKNSSFLKVPHVTMRVFSRFSQKACSGTFCG